MCCALSSTCSEPYTSASAKWDGYLNYALSRFRLAADRTPVEAEKEVEHVEPLCSLRTASIDLKSATVSIDTSGGKLKMLWQGVAEVEGEKVDLVVQSVGDNMYSSGTGETKKDGGNGIINLALGSQTELQFSFQDQSEKCVEFDEIHFTALDITHTFDSKMEEIWEFSDFAGYVVKPNSEIEVLEDGDDLVLKSTGAGWCNGESIDAMNLKEVTCETVHGNTITYEEDRRAAMVVYKRTCEFGVTIKAPGSPTDMPSGWPFTFTFGSMLAELCS